MDLIGPRFRGSSTKPAQALDPAGADSRNERIVTRLSQATNPVWKAVSVYVLGQPSGKANQDLFQREAHNTNAWVRLAAVTALARQSTTRADLETKIVPFLSDQDTKVVGAAFPGCSNPRPVQPLV